MTEENVYEDPVAGKFGELKLDDEDEYDDVELQKTGRDDEVVKAGTPGEEGAGQTNVAEDGGERGVDVPLNRDGSGSVSSKASSLRRKIYVENPSSSKISRDRDAEKKRDQRSEKMERERLARLREKKFKEQMRELEKQKAERRRRFGKLPGEVGWKATLSFSVFCFAVLAGACTLVVFIFVEARVERSTPDAIVLESLDNQTARILQILKTTYSQLRTQMDALKEKVRVDSEAIHALINEQRENLTKIFAEKQESLMNRIQQRTDEFNELMKEQDTFIHWKFDNQTVQISEKAEEQHGNISSVTDDLGRDLVTMAEDQSELTERMLIDLDEKMEDTVEAQETLLEAKMDNLKETVEEGVKNKIMNKSTELQDMKKDMEGDVGNLLTEVNDKTREEAIKLSGKMAAATDTLRTAVTGVDTQLSTRTDTQDGTIQSLISDAIVDVNAYTSGVKEELAELLEGKLGASSAAIIGQLDGAMDDIGDAASAVEDENTDTATDVNAKLDVLESGLDDLADDITELGVGLDGKVTAGSQELVSSTSLVLKLMQPQTCGDVRYLTANDWSQPQDGGVFDLYPPSYIPNSLTAFCSGRDGGGWMVIQRNEDTASNFEKTFEEYKTGFGTALDGNYWIGLESMHKLTTSDEFTLKIELTGGDSSIKRFYYNKFEVGNEAGGFVLTIASFITAKSDTVPTNGDFTAHDGKAFSASDSGPQQACATNGKGGWWFIGAAPNCNNVKLNGVRYATSVLQSTNTDGVFFGTGANAFWSRSEMFIKTKPNAVRGLTID